MAQVRSSRRSFVAGQRSKKTPFHVTDRRIMLSLGPLSRGKYCTYSCPFCYVGDDFLSYASLTRAEIVDWVASVSEPYDVIYVSCDTDSFAPPREAQALGLLNDLAEFGVDLLFTTRAVLSDTTIARMGRIADQLRRNGRLLIGCVSLAQLSVPQLEPHPIPPPTDRLSQLARLRAAGLQTVLALRPFLPNVPLDDYREIVRLGAAGAMVVVGGVWYHDRAGTMQGAVMPEGWGPEESSLGQMDFDANEAEWLIFEGKDAERAVDEACRAHGLPLFMRSRPAIEWLREARRGDDLERIATGGG
jgi:DNA repair photolyase